MTTPAAREAGLELLAAIRARNIADAAAKPALEALFPYIGDITTVHPSVEVRAFAAIDACLGAGEGVAEYFLYERLDALDSPCGCIIFRAGTPDERAWVIDTIDDLRAMLAAEFPIAEARS